MISSRGLKLRLGRYQFLSNRSYTSWFTRGSFRFSPSSNPTHTHTHTYTKRALLISYINYVKLEETVFDHNFSLIVRVHSFDLSPDYTTRLTHVILRSHNTWPRLKVHMTDFFLFAWSNLNDILIWISKIIFRFRFSFPALLSFKNVKFYFRSCQKPRKGRPGHSHVVMSYQERSPCENKLRGPHCGDLIHFVFLYSATAKLSTKLCETAIVTSNLGSDLDY